MSSPLVPWAILSVAGRAFDDECVVMNAMAGGLMRIAPDRMLVVDSRCIVCG